MRLLSYNIHKGIGGRDQKYSLDRIIEVIELENPDLVCLQEVDRNVRRSRFDNQPRLLADWFQPAGKLFQLNVRLQRGGYGNLLLSRWPLVESHQISLRLLQRKPRGAQLAVVNTPQGALQVVNFHLGLSARERRWQVEHLLGNRCFVDGADLPTLIAGDYNDWRNLLAPILAANGFVQATSPPSRFRSFPAYLPVGSLDKAYQRGALSVLQARVVRTPLAHRASDHLPLVVDFHLEPGAGVRLTGSRRRGGRRRRAA